MAGSRIFTLGLALAAAAVSAAGVSLSARAQPSPQPASKPAALVAQVCQGCHGPEVIGQMGRSRDDWTTVVQTMVERGAMASDDDLQAIVDYLAATYPAGKAAGQ